VEGRIKKLDTHTHTRKGLPGGNVPGKKKSKRNVLWRKKKTPLDEENERRRTRKETDRNSRVVSEEKEVVDSLLTKNPEGKINNVDCRQPVLPFLVLSRSPLLLLLL
jgi:hypothetical protein